MILGEQTNRKHYALWVTMIIPCPEISDCKPKAYLYPLTIRNLASGKKYYKPSGTLHLVTINKNNDDQLDTTGDGHLTLIWFRNTLKSMTLRTTQSVPLCSLIDSLMIDLKPFLLPRVFIWIPQNFFSLANYMPFCFKCKKILRPNGLSTGFRRVFDLKDIFYLQSFSCSNVHCNVGSVSNADAQFVSLLPKEVGYLFPAITTSKCDISHHLAVLKLSLDAKALGYSGFAKPFLNCIARHLTARWSYATELQEVHWRLLSLCLFVSRLYCPL